MSDPDGGFDKFTISTIVVLSVVIIIPLVFFTFATRRLCCDKQIRHTFEHKEGKYGDDDNEETSLDSPPKIFLTFCNVRYSVPIGNGVEKEILKGVSAYMKPGTLTAIMGPSGCGKSTCLDILADQKEFGRISGDIRINGERRTSLFRRATAYVMQFDVLYPNLTPKETLYFVTELRLGEQVSSQEKWFRVLKTLKELDLVHVADTRMGEGDGGGGLSGGQKRRVTVAIELVTGPGLILLDEPTSGLDAFGSLQLVNVLRKLADKGRTIGLTIHQPRADIFKLFDNLLLMKLGVVMYFGGVDGIFPYFEKLGVEVDYNVNPADFIVDLTQDKTDEDFEEEKIVLERLQFEQSKRTLDISTTDDQYSSNLESIHEDEEEHSVLEDAKIDVKVGEEQNDSEKSQQQKEEDKNNNNAGPADSVSSSSSSAPTAEENKLLDDQKVTQDDDKLKEQDNIVKADLVVDTEISNENKNDNKSGGSPFVPGSRRTLLPEEASRRDLFKPKKKIDLDSLCDLYQNSHIRIKHSKIIVQVQKGKYPDTPPTLESFYGGKSANASEQKYATGFFRQVYTLAQRAIINDMRNGAYLAGNWVLGPIMMLFYGALYSNISPPETIQVTQLEQGLVNAQACTLNDQYLSSYIPATNISQLATCGEDINNQQSLAFVRSSLIYQFMAASYFSEGPFVPQVYLDKQMFIREHNSRSYSSGAYHFAWYLRMFFSAFMKGVFFSPLGYFAAQLRLDAEAYFIFSIFFGGMSAAGASMALLCSSIFPSLETAQAVFVLINILAQNLCGYWVVSAYIPPWFIWIYYMNFFRYAFEGTILGQQINQNVDYRDTAWLYTLIVIFFAIGFQLLAFISTWLTYRTKTTSSIEMTIEDDLEVDQDLTEELDDLDDEDEDSLSRFSEKMQRASSASAKRSPMGGVSRNNFMSRYREAQLASTRNIGSTAHMKKNLANNGGIIFTN